MPSGLYNCRLMATCSPSTIDGSRSSQESNLPFVLHFSSLCVLISAATFPIGLATASRHDEPEKRDRKLTELVRELTSDVGKIKHREKCTTFCMCLRITGIVVESIMFPSIL
uniref:Uncharacterized protein n=1 Tax=Anopheles maculatus TaxID=74869 RepID=A0A182SB00_9DIPT